MFNLVACMFEHKKKQLMTSRCVMWRWDVSHHLSFQLLVAVDQLLMLSLRHWLYAFPPAKGSPTVIHFVGFNAILDSLICSAVLCLHGCCSSPGHLPVPSMIDLTESA